MKDDGYKWEMRFVQFKCVEEAVQFRINKRGHHVIVIT